MLLKEPLRGLFSCAHLRRPSIALEWNERPAVVQEPCAEAREQVPPRSYRRQEPL